MSEPFFAVDFYDDNIGVTAGTSGGGTRALLHTTDGGQTWTPNSIAGNLFLNKLHFIDESTGFVVGPGGYIAKTTNAGGDWSVVTSGTNSELFDIYFTSADTGLVLGASGAIRRTIDGGESWEAVATGTNQVFRSITQLSDDELVAVAGPANPTGSIQTNLIFKSEDSGETWEEVAEIRVRGVLNSIANFDSLALVTVGSTGAAAVSSDGGSVWTNPSLLVQSVIGISVADRATAMAYSFDFNMAVTTDAGQTWQRWSVGEIDGFLATAYLFDANHALLSAPDGVLYRTRDGGETWDSNNLDTDQTLNDMVFTDSGVGIGTSLSGGVWRTVDYGETWEAISEVSTGVQKTSVSWNGEQTFVITEGSNQLSVSHDLGLTWSQVGNDLMVPVRKVVFADSLLGIGVGSSGNITRTVDGGRTWTALTRFLTNANLVSASFPSPDFLVIPVGVNLQFSEDAGETFTALSSLPSSPTDRVSFIDKFQAYATGSGGHISTTINGAGMQSNTPEELKAVSPVAVTLNTNTRLSDSLRVRVVDTDNNPLEGVRVEFVKVESPDGSQGESLRVSAPLSNDAGEVAAEFRSGDVSGTFRIEARVPGISEPVVAFVLTVQEPVVSSIEVADGADQTGFVSEPVQPFAVRVLDDAGDGLASIPVNFEISTQPDNATGAVLSGSSVLSDDNGLASVVFTPGNAAGTYEVTATTPTLATALTFTITATMVSSDDLVWEVIQPTPQPNQLQAVAMLSPDVIVASGAGGTLLKSTDGGLSWDVTYLVTGLPIMIYDMSFHGQNGWAVGGNGTILKSTDAGSNWSPVVSGSSATLRSITVLPNQTLLAGGASGTLLKSEDGGDSWSTIDLPINARINGISFGDNNRGWIVLNERVTIDDETSSVMITTDGGETWSIHDHPAPGPVFAVDFFDANHGFMGSAGSLYSTSNGGDTWSQQASQFNNQIDAVTAVKATGTTAAWATDQTGSIFETTNGSDWTAIYRNTDNAFRSVARDVANGVVVGDRGQMLFTQNSGESWSAFRENLGRRNVADIHFVSNDLGFLVNESRFIYRTTNGGSDWRPYDTEVSVGIAGSFGFTALHFSDENNGWSVNLVGDVARTNDGGETWQQDRKQAVASVRSVFAWSEENIWLGGDGGLLLRSSDAIVTSIDNSAAEVPLQVALGNNYPNPFNPVTTIPFELNAQEHVRLEVFDLLGRRVATLVDNQLPAGLHQVQFDASRIASGVYVYRLEAGSWSASNKMILVK